MADPAPAAGAPPAAQPTVVVESNPEALEDAKDVERGAAAAAPEPVRATADASAMQDVPLDKPVVRPQDAAKAVAKDLVSKLQTREFVEQMGLIAILSIIELIQAGIILRDQGGSMNAWAVSVGAISFIVAAGVGLAESYGSQPLAEDAKFVVSLFFFLWWTAAVISLTFFGPFQSTCGTIFVTGTGAFAGVSPSANGYIPTWLCWIFATRVLTDHSHRFSSLVSKAAAGADATQSLLWLLFISSVVVMGAAIAPCSPAAACVSYEAWALSMGTISAGIVLLVLLLNGGNKVEGAQLRFIALFLLLWWTIGTAVATFGGPFAVTGNGYIFSYASLFLSYGVLRSLEAGSSVAKTPATAAPPATATGNAI